MEWGSVRAFLQKRVERGLPTPAWDSMPDELIGEQKLVWNAFTDLNRSRTVGMSLNPIQLSEIHTWLQLHLIYDPDLRLEIVDGIYVLDAKWLSDVNKKNDKRK